MKFPSLGIQKARPSRTSWPSLVTQSAFVSCLVVVVVQREPEWIWAPGVLSVPLSVLTQRNTCQDYYPFRHTGSSSIKELYVGRLGTKKVSGMASKHPGSEESCPCCNSTSSCVTYLKAF